MTKHDNRIIGKSLIITGLLFTVVFVLGLMIMSNSVVRIRGDVFEQLQQISGNSSTYRIGFLFTGLTAPLTAALIVILAFFVQTRKTTPILNILSVFFLLPYTILESVAYLSQSTYFISALETNGCFCIVDWTAFAEDRIDRPWHRGRIRGNLAL